MVSSTGISASLSEASPVVPVPGCGAAGRRRCGHGRARCQRKHQEHGDQRRIWKRSERWLVDIRCYSKIPYWCDCEPFCCGALLGQVTLRGAPPPPGHDGGLGDHLPRRRRPHPTRSNRARGFRRWRPSGTRGSRCPWRRPAQSGCPATASGRTSDGAAKPIAATPSAPNVATSRASQHDQQGDDQTGEYSAHDACSCTGRRCRDK